MVIWGFSNTNGVKVIEDVSENLVGNKWCVSDPRGRRQAHPTKIFWLD